MQAASTHITQGFNARLKRPWYRRGLTLLSAATIAATACWVSGLFDSALLSAEKSEKVTNSSASSRAENSVQATDTAPPTPIGNDSSIPPVPLPLVLTGTMPGRNAREGVAFIGIDESSPQTYSAGALLANGARIVEIYTDHVVLERDTKRAKLYLHGTGKNSDSTQLAALLTVGGAASPPPAQVTHREILTDYIRPSPVYDGQVLQGYQVYPGERAGVFSRMGLEAGDVIKSINGMVLAEPTSAIEQLKLLTQGYAMTATVVRQGRVETLSLNGGLITADQEQLRNPSTDTNLSMPAM